jgi:Rrf2 family protein
MRVSAKAEYACLAMLELAAQRGPQPVRVKAIADAQGITPHFLTQILLQLKVAGLVTSVRGASGGYQLAHSPEQISLAQIVRAIDDRALTAPGRRKEEGGRRKKSSSDSSFILPPSSFPKEVLQDVWQEVHALEEQFLENLSLADLLRRGQQPDSLTYQI